MDRRNQSYNTYRATGYEVQPQIRNVPGQAQPSAALQKKVRPGQEDATRRVAGNTRRSIDEPINLSSLTKKVARKEVSAIEHYRDMVQQGMMAESGLSGRPDYGRAQALYCEAARGGYPDAMVRLGWIYEEGKGVPKNTDMAATLFQRAARFGSDIAQDLTQRYKMGKEVLPPLRQGQHRRERLCRALGQRHRTGCTQQPHRAQPQSGGWRRTYQDRQPRHRRGPQVQA